ncbi:MAG: shikimate dehydrogenase, partial [Pseudomonadota bacterium]
MVIRAGVLGHPIAHSLSPRIHGAWFDTLGIEGIYEAVDAPPEEFPDVVKRLADEGWQGVNVTIPHKTAAAQLADHRTEAVDAFGA